MRHVERLAAKRGAAAETRRLNRAHQRDENKVCFRCRQPGHTLVDCPQAEGQEGSKRASQPVGICFKCGSTEHSIKACRRQLPEGSFPFAKCFICGETGHLSRACPDNPRGLYPNGGCCRECGSVEHYRRDCPQLQKASRGIPNLVLRTSETGIEDNDVAVEEDSEAEDVSKQQAQRRTGKKVVVF